MSTVASRTFRSTPYRDAEETWLAIVELLTKGLAGPESTELLSVSGVVSSVIADQAPSQAPIVVTSSGPRTRIYCLYDDDSLDEGDADEGPLGFDPLSGDWHVSLPCLAEDLAWVQATLERKSARVTARNVADGISTESSKTSVHEPLVLNERRLLGL